MPDFKNQKSSDQALATINRDLQEKSTQDRAKEFKLPYIDVAGFPINPDILHVLDLDTAKRGQIMPFFKTGKTLRMAVADPKKPETQEVLKSLTDKGFKVELSLASASGLADAFKLYASDQYKLKTEIKNVVEEGEIRYEKELENLVKLKDAIAGLPAEEALNTLNVSAIKSGASDIHFQPEETECMIRFRIDGVLHNAFAVAKETYSRITDQLKYKAKMKMNITSVPQDGRYRFIVNERKIDVRVSSLPTEYGETFVCRILDSGKHFSSFEELGFTGKSLEMLKKSAELAQGMVLVTGPTSSGKTTTLYVLLTQFNKPDAKIITLEDPIEYHLQGITQSQVNEKEGYNFASGLRSILRQDPDILMIGEIRDQETAEVCSQAALTGHVVLSTLHTNSAVDTIPRLITMGLPAFMIAPALSTVVAQRLVRKLCKACAKEVSPTEEERALLENTISGVISVFPDFATARPSRGEAKQLTPRQGGATLIPQKIKEAKGCEECNFTGYRGQLVISEVLLVTEEIKEAILRGKPAFDLFTLGRKGGMLTMMEDAILKVIAGDTTLAEVHRVINA